MPAFGSNAITCAFARRILYEPVKGFRLSDRIVSAIDRFIGALTRFRVPGDVPAGIMNRFGFIYPFVGATDWTHSLNLADAPDAGYASGGPLGGTGKFNKHAITWSGGAIHNALGVTMPSGAGGNTNIDGADATNFYSFWNRKSWGFYSRTNSAVNVRDLSSQFTEPRNGYTYWQGIHARWGDGICYGDLCWYSKSGVTTVPDRNQVAVSDSLGLYSDNQRSQYGNIAPYHYMYKRGQYIAGDNTGEIGMGYGDVGSGAWVVFGNGSGRNYSFLFCVRHPRVLEGPVNTDGTGGQMPGSNGDFNYFVEQLQVALLRNV